MLSKHVKARRRATRHRHAIPAWKREEIKHLSSQMEFVPIQAVMSSKHSSNPDAHRVAVDNMVKTAQRNTERTRLINALLAKPKLTKKRWQAMPDASAGLDVLLKAASFLTTPVNEDWYKYFEVRAPHPQAQSRDIGAVH